MKFTLGLLLKFNGRNEIKLGKFKVKWLGLYKVRQVVAYGSIKLWTLDGREILDVVKLFINGYP